MRKTPSPKRFLRWFGGSIFGGVVLCLGLVILIDPYDQFRIGVFPGFNLIKPRLGRYQNEIKLSQAARIDADALILGHSRAEVGFDPEAPAFARRGLTAYNLAIPGTSIDTARRQVEYLLQTGSKPKVLILGVEFLDFMEAPRKEPANASPMLPEIKKKMNLGWFWRFDTVFSLASVKDAIHTLFIQHDQKSETQTSKGFNPLNEYQALVRREGHFVLFRQRAHENSKVYLAKANGSLSLADLAHLRAILAMARELDSDVNLVIYPYHAQILALFEETGLFPLFEEWKGQLIHEISVARRLEPNAHIALFDFSGYGPYNCEKIPVENDRESSTRWYWEAGHFKKELGDVVLNRVLPDPATPHLQPDSENRQEVFGFRLNESSAVRNSQRMHMERLRCATEYPALFEEAAYLAEEARKTRQLPGTGKGY